MFVTIYFLWLFIPTINLVQEMKISTDLRFGPAVHIPPAYLEGLVPGIKDDILLYNHLDFKQSCS